MRIPMLVKLNDILRVSYLTHIIFHTKMIYGCKREWCECIFLNIIIHFKKYKLNLQKSDRVPTYAPFYIVGKWCFMWWVSVKRHQITFKLGNLGKPISKRPTHTPTNADNNDDLDRPTLYSKKNHTYRSTMIKTYDLLRNKLPQTKLKTIRMKINGPPPKPIDYF